MTEPATIVEAEVVDEQPSSSTSAIQLATPHGLANLHGTSDPKQMIEIATAQADALAEVVESRKLYVNIRSKKHVTVEGWTTLGAMVGVFPILHHVTTLETPAGFAIVRNKDSDNETSQPLAAGKSFGFVAVVEARTMAGAVVGSAETECTRAETMWQDRDDHALRSMAQTRATSKSLRIPLGFIMQLAGFNPTPEEEMPAGGARIPDVPDMHHLPEGWTPGPWAKQTLLVLTGGNKALAMQAWEDLIATHPPAGPEATQEEAEILVNAAHELFPSADDGPEDWSDYG